MYFFHILNSGLFLDSTSFQIQVAKALKGSESSVFAERTEDSSALQYFQVIAVIVLNNISYVEVGLCHTHSSESKIAVLMLV